MHVKNEQCFQPHSIQHIAQKNDRLLQQGYAIGNGVTDDEVDGNAIIPFAHGKSLLGTQLYLDLMQECQGSFWNATPGKPLAAFSYPHSSNNSPSSVHLEWVTGVMTKMVLWALHSTLTQRH